MFWIPFVKSFVQIFCRDTETLHRDGAPTSTAAASTPSTSGGSAKTSLTGFASGARAFEFERRTNARPLTLLLANRILQSIPIAHSAAQQPWGWDQVTCW